MKISFLKRTKPNDRFNYTPRYYKGKDDDNNPYDFDTKFDKFRGIYNKNDFGNHWRDARFASRNKGNVGFNKLILLIIVLLVFVFLWIIDFDVSMFTQSF